MTDPLVEQIRATPDDDAPRLVWADREGGVLGELVVIQCRLATGGIPRTELGPLISREEQILEQIDAGSRYERGFAVHADAPADWLTEDGLARLVARQPLLRSIQLLDAYVTSYSHQPATDWPAFIHALASCLERLPGDRITELTAHAIHQRDGAAESYADQFLAVLAACPIASTLRVLRVFGQVDDVNVLERFPALEELVIQPPAHDDLVPFLEHHPRLTRLTVHDSRREQQVERLFASPALGQLTRLEMQRLETESMYALARSPHLGGLLHLALFGEPIAERDVDAHEAVFAAVPNLRQLNLYEAATDPLVEAVARAPFAEPLRILSLMDGYVTGAAAPVLRALPALERLSLASIHHSAAVKTELATLRSAIPHVVV